MGRIAFNLNIPKMRLLVAVVQSVLLTGCLTEPNSQPSDLQPEGSIGDGVSVLPSVLCGEDRAVVGVDENDQVVCDSVALKGIPAVTDTQGTPNCPDGFTGRMILVPGPNGDVQLPTCDGPESTAVDNVTLGMAPTEIFRCPDGAFLRGFSERGEPICGTAAGPEISMAAFMTETECPWGFTPLAADFGHFQARLCRTDNPNLETKFTGQRVVRYPVQVNIVCPNRGVVIGFDERHRIICGRGPKNFKKNPPTYWATVFDTNFVDRPLCRANFQAMPLFAAQAGGGNLIKVWTCVHQSP
jgi:hypothetical protein